jgi:thiol:disulfide interchange protein DsbC
MKKLILAIAFMLPCLVSAQEITSSVEKAIKMALPNTQIDSIETSEMPGLYMITAGMNIFYFNPDKNLLFVGEILTTSGANLTTPNRAKAVNTNLSHATKSAMTIQYGEPLNVIYEFTNPECGACLNYEKYIKQNPLKDTVRHIFFLSWSPSAKKKLEHIMCSTDKEAAKELIYSGADVKEFATCEQGKKQVEEQYKIAKKLGVDRTPTFIVNGTRMAGLKADQFNQLLKVKS